MANIDSRKQKFADIEVNPNTLSSVPAGSDGQIAVVTDQSNNYLYVRNGGSLVPVIDTSGIESSISALTNGSFSTRFSLLKENTTGNWQNIATTTDGSVILASNTDGYLYISLDNGNTWTQKDATGDHAHTNYTGVTLNGGGGQMAAIATLTNGDSYVYSSTDGGSTWQQYDATGSPGVHFYTGITFIGTGSNQLSVCTNNEKIYTTPDYGATWYTGDSVNASYTCIASNYDSTLIIAGDSNGYLHISRDYGHTWDNSTYLGSSEMGNLNSLAIDYLGNTIIVNFGYIYISIDNGNTFTQSSIDQGDWYSNTIGPNGAIFYCGSPGSFVSKNNLDGSLILNLSDTFYAVYAAAQANVTYLTGNNGIYVGEVVFVNDIQREIDSLSSSPSSITNSTINMRVDPVNGISPSSSIRVTSQSEYDSLGYDLKYIQDAIDILPQAIAYKVVVRLASGTHLAKPGATGFGGYPGILNIMGRQGASRKPYVDSGFDTGYFNNEINFMGESSDEYEAEQAGSVNNNVITRSSGSWTPDELRGKFVNILTGTGAGTIRPIMHNDATTLIFASFGAGVGSCTFSIITPNAIILDSIDGVNPNEEGMTITNNSLTIGFTNVQIGSSLIRMSMGMSNNGWSVISTSCLFLGSSGYAVGLGYHTYDIYWTGIYMNIDTSYPVSVWDGGVLQLWESAVDGKSAALGVIVAEQGGGLNLAGNLMQALPGNTVPLISSMANGYIYNNGGIELDCKSICNGISMAASGEVGSKFFSSYGNTLNINNALIAVDVHGSQFDFPGTPTGTGNVVGWSLNKGALIRVDNPSGLVATNPINIDGDIKPYSEIPNAGDALEGKGGSRFIR